MLAEPVVPPVVPEREGPSAQRIAEVARAVEWQRASRRSVTVGLKVLKRELVEEALADAEPLPERPKTREECLTAPRPCPWVGCKFHLYLDVTNAGSIQFNHPGRSLDDCPATCALDVADLGGQTLEEVGAVMQITRERVRQVESRALRRLIQAVEKMEGRLVTHAPLGAGRTVGVRHCVACGEPYRPGPGDENRRCPGCRR